MSKINRCVAPCPYCGEETTAIIRLPRFYNETLVTTSKCWNAEKQAGCMKDYEVHQEIKVSIHKTAEDRRIEMNKRLNSGRSLGGSLD